MAQVTIKEMLDAGVHFGHQTQRWNPKMKNFVFGSRGGIHIIDLQKSVLAAQAAAEAVRKLAANGGRMIFVGTKKQAVEPIQEAAKKCGQYYVTKRWLGGTLTNFATIKEAIDRLKKIEMMKEKGEYGFYNKKERARIDNEYNRLLEFHEGIREMKEPPTAMFVVDLKKEHIAIAEALRLGMTVIGIADTNSDPTIIDYPIPGNDDAIRSIKLFSNLIADSFAEGAKDFEQKLRTESDKNSDAEREARRAKSEEKLAASGVKVSRRKLVAAGTADDVEIGIELERQPEGAAIVSDTEQLLKDEEVEAKPTSPKPKKKK